MTQETNAPEIQANFDKLNDKEHMVFRFKKDKLGNKRPNVELDIPVPSFEGIVEILSNGGKGAELLKEVVADTIRTQVAGHVSENENVSQENIPLNLFTWEHIANLDKKDRRTVTISEEQWTEFAKDYIEVMSKATSKTEKQLAAAIQVYMAKFSMFKTDKPTLNQLKAQLGIYMENTKSEDQFSDIIEVLLRRLDSYLKSDDVAALAAAL